MKLGPPIDGAPNLFSVAYDLGAAGYETHEHFVSGEAAAYDAVGDHGPDGHWDVTRAGTAPFTTRLVVYAPADPARANGTVIVEWLNVTGGLDVPALWMATQRHLVRAGYTWVGVSAQLVSVVGGGIMPGLGLRDAAPERYAPLDHPGDRFCYDIFGTIGRTLRTELTDRYGLRVDRMLAAGQSQSAFHLTTYINAIDRRDEVFDGFLIGGRAGAAAPLEAWGAVNFDATPESRAARRARLTGRDHIRDDVRVPVMVVQSETDVLGTLAYLPARQPDTERFRLWEVAGSAHCDTYFLGAAGRDDGTLPVTELAELIARSESLIPTASPINSGPQMHYVLQRAVDALDDWMRDGTLPASAARLEVDGNGAFVLDPVGNARGGVRTPWVDVPASVLSGLGQPGDMTELFGTTVPLDAATAAARYPHGWEQYVEEFTVATRAAVEAGFLLAVDAPEIEALGALAGAKLFGS